MASCRTRIWGRNYTPLFSKHEQTGNQISKQICHSRAVVKVDLGERNQNSLDPAFNTGKTANRNVHLHPQIKCFKLTSGGSTDRKALQIPCGNETKIGKVIKKDLSVSTIEWDLIQQYSKSNIQKENMEISEDKGIAP